MAATRVIRPFARTVPGMRIAAPTVAPISRRFLNTDTAPTLYTVHSKATGGRNGHVEGSEGLKLTLGTPKQMGGKGEKGKTNPEELFAAGYGACFQSAMGLSAEAVGVKMPSKPGDCIVETSVHMVGDIKALDLGLRVEMHVKAKGVSKEDLEKVVEKTKQVCPYSRATQGNVTTTVTVESM